MMIIAIAALFWMKWDNRRRNSKDGGSELEGLSQQQVEELEWRHPDFRWSP
jgi:hypothetical protein